MKRSVEITTLTTTIFMIGFVFGAYFMTGLSSVSHIDDDDMTNGIGKSGMPTTILFLGDLMLDRHVALKMDKFDVEYPFAPIQEFLKSSNFVVANAEGVFGSNVSITKGVENAPLRFTFSTSTLPFLKVSYITNYFFS